MIHSVREMKKSRTRPPLTAIPQKGRLPDEKKRNPKQTKCPVVVVEKRKGEEIYDRKSIRTGKNGVQQ